MKRSCEAERLLRQVSRYAKEEEEEEMDATVAVKEEVVCIGTETLSTIKEESPDSLHFEDEDPLGFVDQMSEDVSNDEVVSVSGSGSNDYATVDDGNVNNGLPKPINVSLSLRNKCTICEKRFFKRTELLNHTLNSHKIPRPYQCNVCKKRFTQKHYVTLHMRVHTGERPYKCKLCNNTYSHKTSFTIHMRMHNGERPYMCGLCDRRYYDKASFTSHMRSHTKEIPYECEVCGRHFSTSKTLLIHHRNHTGEKPYECQYCGKVFRRWHARKIHIIRVHTDKRPHKCNICGKGFPRTDEVKNHMKSHEGIKSYRCSLCSVYCASLESLSGHMDLRHAVENASGKTLVKNSISGILDTKTTYKPVSIAPKTAATQSISTSSANTQNTTTTSSANTRKAAATSSTNTQKTTATSSRNTRNTSTTTSANTQNTTNTSSVNTQNTTTTTSANTQNMSTTNSANTQNTTTTSSANTRSTTTVSSAKRRNITTISAANAQNTITTSSANTPNSVSVSETSLLSKGDKTRSLSSYKAFIEQQEKILAKRGLTVKEPQKMGNSSSTVSSSATSDLKRDNGKSAVKNVSILRQNATVPTSSGSQGVPAEQIIIPSQNNQMNGAGQIVIPHSVLGNRQVRVLNSGVSTTGPRVVLQSSMVMPQTSLIGGNQLLMLSPSVSQTAPVMLSQPVILLAGRGNGPHMVLMPTKSTANIGSAPQIATSSASESPSSDAATSNNSTTVTVKQEPEDLSETAIENNHPSAVPKVVIKQEPEQQLPMGIVIKQEPPDNTSSSSINTFCNFTIKQEPQDPPAE